MGFRCLPAYRSFTLFCVCILSSCGGSSASVRDNLGRTSRTSTAGSAKSWVVLQIDRVQVSPKKADGSTWDGKLEKGGNGCGALAVIGKAAGGPVGGAVATFLCERSGDEQAERDPSAPDLFVQVTASDVKFTTPIAVNTFDEAFKYPIVMPLDGIGQAGLEIDVFDQDADIGQGEHIGQMRVSSKDIATARSKTPPVLSLHDGHVEQLDVVVLPYEAPAAVAPIDFDVKQPMRALKTRARPGELVRISASGSYSVANDQEKLTPSGYVNGDKRNYNLKGFETTNHAAAVALVGPMDETHSSLTVGDCIATIALVEGTISVGINDDDRDNNEGSVKFDVQVGLPTVEEWRTGESARCDKDRR